MFQACQQQSGWATMLQTWLTPVIAFATIVLGVATYLIQREQAKSAAVQAKSARLQAETNHLQYRLALFEKRMKVFVATMNLIRASLSTAKTEMNDLYRFIIDTREHEFLFGPEIAGFINEVYNKGVQLNTAAPGIERGEHDAIQQQMEALKWFAKEVTAGTTRFVKYLDFREP